MFIYIFLFIVGLAVGSYINVCIYRIPRELSTVFPRSFCPVCSKTVGWFDNIPVLSFLLLRGRCRSCSSKISLQYIAVELLTAFVFLSAGIVYSAEPLMMVFGLIFCSFLIVISGIDYFHQIIPFCLLIPLIVFSAAVSPFNIFLGDTYAARIINSVASASASFVILYLIGYVTSKVIKKEALGGADPLLLAGIAGFLGWKGSFAALFAASIYGLIVVCMRVLIKKYNPREPFAFGPFLSAGALSYLIFKRFFDDVFKILVD